MRLDLNALQEAFASIPGYAASKVLKKNAAIGTVRWEALAVADLPSGITSPDYLVGTSSANLSAEIVVGTTPGGELGGTWAAPTVDATHSGSAHLTSSFAAGTSWTPTITPTGGAFTTVTGAGYWRQVNKMLYFSLTITQTNVGTGTGSHNFALPNSTVARDATSFSGVANNLTGLSALVLGGASTVSVQKYDTSTAIANGLYLIISGWVEVN